GRHRRVIVNVFLVALAGAVPVVPVVLHGAQSPQATPVTAADYARAERFLAPRLAGLVVGGSVAATWLPDDRFWYRTTLADGTEQTILVDPARKTRTVCTSSIPECRTFTGAPPSEGGQRGRGFGRGGSNLTSSGGKPLTLSPDGRQGAFVRDWNLWIRAVGRRPAPPLA